MTCCCEKIPKESIQLTQGDDSNAMGNYIAVTFTSDEDLTGFYAIVQLENFQWKFTDLTQENEWIIPRDISAQLDVGEHMAAIKVFDSNDLCRTEKRNIPVYVNAMVVDNPEPEPEPEPTEATDGE